mmetsp:Transcript_46228/g.144988  ORF Transcript_46228/g.144988 Transcript_46228/m.144988 type:complete len:238 (+) Transcript_46228:1232-1945(+)
MRTFDPVSSKSSISVSPTTFLLPQLDNTWTTSSLSCFSFSSSSCASWCWLEEGGGESPDLYFASPESKATAGICLVSLASTLETAFIGSGERSVVATTSLWNNFFSDEPVAAPVLSWLFDIPMKLSFANSCSTLEEVFGILGKEIPLKGLLFKREEGSSLDPWLALGVLATSSFSRASAASMASSSFLSLFTAFAEEELSAPSLTSRALVARRGSKEEEEAEDIGGRALRIILALDS